jgi:hypothetical protein
MIRGRRVDPRASLIAAAEHRAAELARRDLREPCGETRLVLGAQQEVAVVEVLERGVRGRDHARVAPADVEGSSRGEAVEEAPAVDVPDPGARAFGLDDVESGGPHHAHLLRVDEARELLECLLLAVGLQGSAPRGGLDQVSA